MVAPMFSSPLSGRLVAAGVANEIGAAAATLAEALRTATTDPADAIRLLLPLAQWTPGTIPGAGPLARAAQAGQEAVAANLRAAACAALASAAQAYQPVSYQDAQAVRQLVCDVLEREAIACADAGRDASYDALRTLRAAVALDLAVRGANLAALVEITASAPTPSLAMAFALYQDTTREPQLVAAADPPHPLFLPLEFHALSR